MGQSDAIHIHTLKKKKKSATITYNITKTDIFKKLIWNYKHKVIEIIKYYS